VWWPVCACSAAASSGRTVPSGANRKLNARGFPGTPGSVSAARARIACSRRPPLGRAGDKSLGVMAPDQPGASLSRRCRSTAKNHSANTAAPVPVTARHEMSRKDAIGTVATSTAKMTASGPEMLAHSQVTP
jgi:hypothetical protein